MPDRFPFSIRAVRALERIAFPTPVTFFVGENGSGKSTLLEAMATAMGLPTIGAVAVRDDNTLHGQQELGRALRLTWNVRIRRGFFLRAEDFFGFTKAIEQLKAEIKRRTEEIEIEYADRSDAAKALALGPLHGSLAALTASYGEGLDVQSHGESFLKLFHARFVPGGIYLIDEPEAPLSPQSQLGLIAMLKDMVRQEAQFLIATHSPILLAFPNATIYSFDHSPVRQVPFAELDHVTLTRDFLNNPEAFLRRL
ncbi:MAG TPA: AAA family ATPase [Gemmatimonadaceae bacterium]|nr:AAA family ATPase [Gemmatimonadaceae bacterium]